MQTATATLRPVACRNAGKQMKISANGIDIHYTIDGEGPWLTLSHRSAAPACGTRKEALSRH
jgi:hypothetical protein